MANNVAPFRKILLGDPTVAGGGGVVSGTSPWVNCAGATYLTLYYQSIGTTSGGTIVAEEADFSDEPLHDGPYTGTASQIESRNASTFSGGVELAVHITPSAFAWVRVRVTSNITGGGSIIVALRGHE